MTNTMPERFDKKFVRTKAKIVGFKRIETEWLSGRDIDDVKSFIQSEIDLAVAEREKEIVELIEDYINDWGDELYPADKLINLIKTK